MNDVRVDAPAVSPVRVSAGLVLDAMRIAEKAHRGKRRKAPPGLDQPDYFLHLAEVAWRLKDAGLPDTVVAAGYLHDIIEDCGYTRDRLARELGNAAVADLVEQVTEPEKAHNSWQARNSAYRERIRGAPREVLAISIADKTCNLLDMLRLVARGHTLASFLSVGATEQVDKFEQLRGIFEGRVPDRLWADFASALAALIAATAPEREAAARTT